MAYLKLTKGLKPPQRTLPKPNSRGKYGVRKVRWPDDDPPETSKRTETRSRSRTAHSNRKFWRTRIPATLPTGRRGHLNGSVVAPRRRQGTSSGQCLGHELARRRCVTSRARRGRQPERLMPSRTAPASRWGASKRVLDSIPRPLSACRALPARHGWAYCPYFALASRRRACKTGSV